MLRGLRITTGRSCVYLQYLETLGIRVGCVFCILNGSSVRLNSSSVPSNVSYVPSTVPSVPSNMSAGASRPSILALTSCIRTLTATTLLIVHPYYHMISSRFPDNLERTREMLVPVPGLKHLSSQRSRLVYLELRLWLAACVPAAQCSMLHRLNTRSPVPNS